MKGEEGRGGLCEGKERGLRGSVQGKGGKGCMLVHGEREKVEASDSWLESCEHVRLSVSSFDSRK